jgi:hypothetical protein
MPKVRGNPSAKWARKAAVSQQDYAEGVASPRAPWAASAMAAAGSWATGVQAAISGKRFEKGVQKAGDAAWSEGATKKGVARFAEGVAQSTGKYEQGIARYLQVIQSTTLPPRGPKGSAQNYQRSQAMGQALHNAKLAA